MENSMNQNQVTENVNQNEAGCLGIGFSFLFPLIGVIIYFAQKDSVKNPSAYLYGALGGFCTGLLLGLIGAMSRAAY